MNISIKIFGMSSDGQYIVFREKILSKHCLVWQVTVIKVLKLFADAFRNYLSCAKVTVNRETEELPLLPAVLSCQASRHLLCSAPRKGNVLDFLLVHLSKKATQAVTVSSVTSHIYIYIYILLSVQIHYFLQL